MSENKIPFALIGAGFWSQYHLAAWQEIPQVQCVAICDQSREKAEHLSKGFGGISVFDDAKQLLATGGVRFVDIVTDVDSHVPLARQSLEHAVAVICQKPMAPTLEMARSLCALADRVKIPFVVHENWRWQAPLRRFKSILDSGELGNLVRARIDYANSFPVFDNQPALKKLKQFIITDIGTHILDVSRYLFGEAKQLFCQTRRMREDIEGEDVATVLMVKENGLTVVCNMSYASRWQYDRFPQTMVAVEGTKAGASLHADYQIEIYGAGANKRTESVSIPKFDWCHPEYELVHSSMVACQRNLLSGLTGETTAETTGSDNLKTLELVYGSYASAANNCVLPIPLPAGLIL